LPFALISSHLLLGIEQGRFLSSQDPPKTVREAAAACRHVRLWPVLVGDPERSNTMLAAPIIVSDFPQVAAESPGDLFDATEMDEMLTLRIRTLTDEEKREAAATDPRAANLLHRCDAMDERQLRELHGAWRDEGETLTPGMRVRLRPKRNADVYDLALAGKTAVVVSIEQDFEDRVYVTVALDDDPGQDYGIAGRPGHRFYFDMDEIEPIERSASETLRVAASRRILIAGIGNIFLGDDAFGVEVVRRLMERSRADGVVVKDFGIRGFDLACALQDGYDAAILVDAMQRGGSPGTLYAIDPEIEPHAPAASLEMHQLDPVRVIEMVQTMGGRLPCLRVVGCEPETLEPNETGSLSPAVQLALVEAVDMVEQLAASLSRRPLETVG
jgi:hydrogenase maturation protease